jgi:hypothetical protein
MLPCLFSPSALPGVRHAVAISSPIIHIECQSSAAKWKHADLLLYNALLFARYHVPVHTVVVLLRPEAAHANMDGTVDYAPRPEHGSMLLTDALLLTGLRVKRDAATKIFGGIGMMEESDTYLMIVDQGLDRLERMIRRAAKATTWREILETP